MTKRLVLLLFLYSTVYTIHAEKTLSLDSCRSLAITNNKKIQVANQEIENARFKKKAAFTNYLPELSATGSYLRNQKNLSLLSSDQFLPIGTVMPNGSFGFRQDQVNNQWTVINGNAVPLDMNGNPFNPAEHPELIQWKDYTTIPKESFEFDIQNIFVGAITLSQPIYMGGKIRAYNQISRFAEELATTQKNTILQEVILQTDQIYWQIISLTNKLKLANSYVELLRKLETDVQEMISEGIATKADGLSVSVKLNEAEMSLSKVENGLSLSKMALCQLCGLSIQSPIQLADEEITDITLSKKKMDPIDIVRAIGKRSEIKSLAIATNIYKEKEKITLSEHLPNIALIANYITSNPSAFNGYTNTFGGQFNVGIVIKVPIFHFGEGYYQRKAAKIESKIAQIKLDEAKEKIELQINQSLFKNEEAFKNLKKAEQNMEKANENLKYAQLGFEEGVVPPSNVLEAQTAWLSANSEKIDAQIEVKLCEVYLNKAIGELNQ